MPNPLSTRALVSATALAAAALVAVPGAAFAGEAHVAGKQLRFTAANGEANRVTIARTGSNTLTLQDLGAPVTPGTGCTALSASQVRCVAPGPRSGGGGVGAVLLGDGDDTATISASNASGLLDGGAGDDRLTASNGSSSALAGGPGDDTVTGSDKGQLLFGDAGTDRIDGRGGNDEIDGGLGADAMTGGTGTDTVTYAGSGDFPNVRATPVTVTLDGVANDGAPGENDSVAADFENVVGATGADQIVGNGGDNELRLGFATAVGALQGGRVVGAAGDDTVTGAEGADTVDGGEGNDLVRDGDLNGASSTLSGGPGNDLLHAEDVADEDGVTPELELAPTADAISCGPGRDQAYVDTADPRPADCEIFTVRTPTLATTSGTDGKDVIVGVQGDGGNDRINARDGNDRASGLGGDDRITGGAGHDKLSGGDGDDDIRARDGERDRISCGAGRDVVVADRVDRVARDCERVKLPSGTGLAG